LKIIEPSIIQGHNEFPARVFSWFRTESFVLQSEAQSDRIPHLHFARYHLWFSR